MTPPCFRLPSLLTVERVFSRDFSQQDPFNLHSFPPWRGVLRVLIVFSIEVSLSKSRLSELLQLCASTVRSLAHQVIGNTIPFYGQDYSCANPLTTGIDFIPSLVYP